MYYNDSSYWFTIFIFAVLIGLIPAAIAHNKGHNFWGWWFFGAALFILALPLAIVAQPATSPLDSEKVIAQVQNERKCPYCAEMIKREAVVCRFCGREVEPLPVPPAPPGPNFGLPDFNSFVADLVSQVPPDSTQNAELHYKRGLSLMKNQQISEAALAFAQVLHLSPSNDWWNKWAQARLLEIYKSGRFNTKRA